MSMKLDNVAELYELISAGIENIPSRKQAILLRKAGLQSCISGNGFKKLAFDTRRIDQETEYYPRRGLQNYNRSEAFITEAFITEALSQKLANFAKLRNVLESLRHEFGREHDLPVNLM